MAREGGYLLVFAPTGDVTANGARGMEFRALITARTNRLLGKAARVLRASVADPVLFVVFARRDGGDLKVEDVGASVGIDLECVVIDLTSLDCAAGVISGYARLVEGTGTSVRFAPSDRN